jgi:hypothetical protein
MAFTELVPTWMKEICQSYEGDSRAQVPLSKFKEGFGTYSLCTEGVFGPWALERAYQMERKCKTPP